MSKSSILKPLNLTGLLVVFCLSVFGQNSPLVPDAKKDSIWIEQLLKTANQLHPIHQDSNSTASLRWISGKVIYSEDNSSRTAQLFGISDTGYPVFTASTQYIYNGKVVEQDLYSETDKLNFRNNILRKIYRLPDKMPAYVFLFADIKNTPGYNQGTFEEAFSDISSPRDTDYNHIKRITYSAAALRLEKDSLIELTFPPYAEDTDNGEEPDTVSDKSISFTSDINHTKNFPKPFIRYDTLKHALNFLDIYCDGDNNNNYETNAAGCTTDFMNVHLGTYVYKDTAFVLTCDSSYYYPALASLDTIVARHKYIVGKYIINATAVSGYEEFYKTVYGTLTLNYKIGTQTLYSINNDGSDEDAKPVLKPDCRLQKNGSLVLILTDQTNNHGPGACGSASYSDSYFWLVNNNSSRKLFSYSYTTCNPTLTYTFTKGKKEISGKFYVSDTSDTESIIFENSYWKNNSTYVIVVADSSDATNFARNFYLHFNLQNKNAQVTLKAGKLYKPKNTKQ